MIKIFVILLLSVFFSTSVFAKEIILVGDIWCPYTCKDDGENKGYMVDIAKRAFNSNDITVKYISMPWNDAINGVVSGKYDGLVGVSKNEAPYLMFTKIELGIYQDDFYALEDSKWQYHNMDSLKSISLGVVKNYGYNEELQNYILENEKNPIKIYIAESDNPNKENLEKLISKNIDALIINKYVLDYNVKEFNLPNLKKVDANPKITNPDQDNLYIAFSPANPNANKYVEMLDNYLNNKENIQSIQNILNKYGIKYWK